MVVESVKSLLEENVHSRVSGGSSLGGRGSGAVGGGGGGRGGEGMGMHKSSTTTKLVICGHSLGGALASLTAYEISTRLKEFEYPTRITVQVYTFGEPRVGNLQFATEYNRRVPLTYRVVYRDDVVPHVPLESFGYYHEGTEVWVRSKSRYVVCKSRAEDDECSDGRSWLFDYNLEDHQDRRGYSGGILGNDGGNMCPE